MLFVPDDLELGRLTRAVAVRGDEVLVGLDRRARDADHRVADAQLGELRR